MTRFLMLAFFLLLAGCVDDAQGCHQSGGTWDGGHCSAR